METPGPNSGLWSSRGPTSWPGMRDRTCIPSYISRWTHSHLGKRGTNLSSVPRDVGGASLTLTQKAGGIPVLSAPPGGDRF